MHIIQLTFVLLITLFFSPATWASSIAQGHDLFQNVCVYCHGMGDKQRFAPILTGIGERRDVTWLNAWLKNPGKILKYDEYAQALLDGNDYGIHMPQIPSMKDDDKRASVIKYLLFKF
ncbi:MAG: cytochrome c [Mariprofundaceae bacterium]|nr:cytochrome c [Mariprofundaceae bacterium]